MKSEMLKLIDSLPQGVLFCYLTSLSSARITPIKITGPAIALLVTQLCQVKNILPLQLDQIHVCCK